MRYVRKKPPGRGGTEGHQESALRIPVPPCRCGLKRIVNAQRLLLPAAILLAFCSHAQPRQILNFSKSWKFYLGDDSTACQPTYDDGKWRRLNLPHDWSIEGAFSEKHPTTFNQGALPAGVGWYRKTFALPASSKEKNISINFGGVYRNSEVWINGHWLGKRPNGYVSFQYALSPYLKFGSGTNVIAVRVDNSAQPNSRWYTGSGIYRNVWLEAVNKIAFDAREVFVAAADAGPKKATVVFQYRINNASGKPQSVALGAALYDPNGKVVYKDDNTSSQLRIPSPYAKGGSSITISDPFLWSPGKPRLYTLVLTVFANGKAVDRLSVKTGIRSFSFDKAKGFFLNGTPLKILGVCNHHDLGALGAAFNARAAERQLQLLKAMGCNAVRTAHNPPAPELLDLCDRMGFLVMDEAFDVWKKRKNKFDYSVDFDEWHNRDLEDMIKRDRNHPCVILWSIGNEIREQFDSSGTRIAREMVELVKRLDITRPVTSALTENFPEKNFIYQSHALDVLGFNYKLNDYAELPKRFPGEKFIASETVSGLATRGHYDQPSDSFRIWPPDAKAKNYGNPDYTAAAYDNTFAYWGATHEQSWLALKNKPYIAGCFVWSGFDFIGEPVPYQWPARSSYYGIVDLAGFPKDVYYLYQSEWTSKPVLHLFPHWNWKRGDSVDVWAYYNNADEVELFLNGKSLGKRAKTDTTLHVLWRVAYEPGTVKAVSRKDGRAVLTRQVSTAGAPAGLQLSADRKRLKADGRDLSFITVNVVDAKGNLVPGADNLVGFTIAGEGALVGVDNGSQTGTESFKAPQRRAFGGKCLAVVQAKEKAGKITLTAEAKGLPPQAIQLITGAGTSEQ